MAFFKFAFYFPSMIPSVATYLMWGFMYNPSKWGIFNYILTKVGWHQFGWLNVPHFTIPLIVVTMTWAAFGGTALVYMASLQGISQELYEAAALDGAGFFKENTLYHLTFHEQYHFINADHANHFRISGYDSTIINDRRGTE